MMNPPATGDCGFAGLRRASRAVCHLYDLVLSPTQLKITQFTMLRSIAEAGEIAHCDLARQSVGSEETFSRRLASARRCGWGLDAHRRPPAPRLPADGKGTQVLREATPYWERARDRMRRELGDTDWQTLLTLAERVAEAAIRAESAPRRNSRPPAPEAVRAAMIPVPIARNTQPERPLIPAA